ncbi:hypothetical protein A2U01_0109422, partial [Trifolium medium]|nr:hypothetical protein [Trifolium medium]
MNSLSSSGGSSSSSPSMGKMGLHSGLKCQSNAHVNESQLGFG